MKGCEERKEDELDARPPLPHHFLHLIPNPRISSWNTNSLSVYGTSDSCKARRGNIYQNLRQLKAISDIVCLQETHLKEGDVLAARSVFGKNWLFLYNNANGRRGTLTIVSPLIALIYGLISIDLYPQMNIFGIKHHI